MSIWKCDHQIHLLKSRQYDWYFAFNFDALSNLFPDADVCAIINTLEGTNSFYHTLCVLM